MRVWIAIAAAAVLGCTQNEGARSSGEPGTPSEPSRAAPPTASAGASGGMAPSTPYALTPERLEAFLKFQKARTQIYGTMLGSLEKLARADAGADRQVEAMLAQAKAVEQARAQVGLSEQEVRSIEAMVSPILQKRQLAHAFDAHGALTQWNGMKGGLPADQRADLDKSMGELQKQQDEASQLQEERRRFGDANVTLILSRENELTQNHQQWVRTLAGRK